MEGADSFPLPLRHLRSCSTFGNLLCWGKGEMDDAQTAAGLCAFPAPAFTGKIGCERDGNAVKAGKIETEQGRVV